MNTSKRRAALRKNRQITRMRELEAKGINCDKWQDKPSLRNQIIFGKPLPSPTA